VGFIQLKPNRGFGITHPGGQKGTVYKIIVLKVIMHKMVLEHMESAKQYGQKIVVDIDDLFDEIHATNMAHDSTDPKKNRDNNRVIYQQIIETADAIICSTPFISDYYKAKFPKKPIFMVRNSIDTDRWTRLNAVKRKPIIGWLGATPWRSLDLEQLSGFFNEYLESRDVKFHHSGYLNWAPLAHNKLGIINPKERVTVSPMVPLMDLPNTYANFDIGIVPLNDIPFNRAKSFIKGLEYAAAGTPFVASALPEYEYLASYGVGKIASTKNEWFDALDSFLSFEERQKESIRYREIIESEFSISARRKEWISVFREINKL
jgi:glycosyltransferase involved in cell wall biosynthesis